VIQGDKENNMAILEVKNILKAFGDNNVLNDISFSVGAGEVVAIIGPSGSGKSTLLRCINQFETIDSGEIIIDGDTMVHTDESGCAVYADKAALRRMRLKIGLVFQNFNLFPHFSVLRNVTEAPVSVLGLSKREATDIAMKLLKKMGLEEKASQYPYQLSGGQQQRVSIARAMALSPKILFFDEPTSALDPELTGEILKVIRALAEAKMTMVIVTHEMLFARDVADKVIFMDDGVIVEQGLPNQVFDNPKEDRTRQFLLRYSQG
jgi:polar amino acid transport system ATP-binding protein